MSLALAIELERESEGRWIADIPELPGVLVYGCTRTSPRLAERAAV